MVLRNALKRCRLNRSDSRNTQRFLEVIIPGSLIVSEDACTYLYFFVSRRWKYSV